MIVGVFWEQHNCRGPNNMNETCIWLWFPWRNVTPSLSVFGINSASALITIDVNSKDPRVCVCVRMRVGLCALWQHTEMKSQTFHLQKSRSQYSRLTHRGGSWGGCHVSGHVNSTHRRCGSSPVNMGTDTAHGTGGKPGGGHCYSLHCMGRPW